MSFTCPLCKTPAIQIIWNYSLRIVAHHKRVVLLPTGGGVQYHCLVDCELGGNEVHTNTETPP